MTDKAPLTATQAITEVARRVGAVGKGETTQATGKYKYRGIDALTNAIAQHMHDVGLILAPRVTDHHWDPMSRGGWMMTRVVVEYDAYGPAGDKLDTVASALGHGADAEDKGPGKAMSYAYKVAVGELFCIPTDASVDNEATVIPEHEEPITAEQVAQISALFDQITDDSARKAVKVDWARTLSYQLQFTPASQFDAVYASAMDAVEATTEAAA